MRSSIGWGTSEMNGDENDNWDDNVDKRHFGIDVGATENGEAANG